MPTTTETTHGTLKASLRAALRAAAETYLGGSHGASPESQPSVAEASEHPKTEAGAQATSTDEPKQSPQADASTNPERSSEQDAKSTSIFTSFKNWLYDRVHSAKQTTEQGVHRSRTLYKIGEFLATLGGALTMLRDIGKECIDMIGDGISDGADVFKTKCSQAAEAINSGAESVLGSLDINMGTIKDAVKTSFGQLKSFFEGIPQAFMDFFKALGELFATLISGLTTAFSQLEENVNNVTTDIPTGSEQQPVGAESFQSSAAAATPEAGEQADRNAQAVTTGAHAESETTPQTPTPARQ